MNWSLGLEQWSGVLEWILGVESWTETLEWNRQSNADGERTIPETPIQDSNP